MFEIVGIVKNTSMEISARIFSRSFLSVSFSGCESRSFRASDASFGASTGHSEPSLKHAIFGISSDIDVDFQVFKTQIQESLLPERLMALLSGFFGILAALLTAVGLYGVISFLVARRTHEIGIRMALGAGKRRVLSSILRETLLLTVLGIGAGVPITFGVGRFVASMLFGIKPSDPVTLVLAAVVLCGRVGVAAAFIPARPAGRRRSDDCPALRVRAASAPSCSFWSTGDSWLQGSVSERICFIIGAEVVFWLSDR